MIHHHPAKPPLADPGTLRAVGTVVITYALVAGAWIYASDRLLLLLTGSAGDLSRWSTAKGLGFVAVTSAVLAVTLSRQFGRIRQARRELAVSEDRFRSTFDQAAVGIAHVSPEGQWLRANRRLCQILGYSPEELRTLTLQQVAHADDLESDLGRLRRLLEREIDTHAMERQLRRKDGSLVWVHLTASVVSHPADAPASFVFVVEDITARRRGEEALRESHAVIRGFAAHQQRSLEADRARIAREIHDELGGLLTGLRMDLHWLQRRISQLAPSPAIPPLTQRVDGSLALVDATISAIQRIAWELRPGILDNLGLAPAIRREVHRFQTNTGIQCQVSTPPGEMTLAADTSIALYRILQEALTNVTRHAAATHVGIELRLQDGQVVLVIEDNGVGMNPAQQNARPSLGLLGMQERARILGGNVAFGPGRSRGTRVVATVPVTPTSSTPPAPSGVG